ncbi:FMN-binding negative transcriptional regulator [Paenibacillus sp. CF384]|uniref:FMN-binding negative transcriptional regulator n=1 Tax=Paenibacillus sp. CF384 TaxID=1884382 RepID=UPI000896D117|nr:FMN-binding negative transcriptional regulator [Paenibacillus sp. CF384]SDW61491.1 negative transcriptional regulator, PaiB family [Paenibacillus sp. CF384]
MYIPKYFEVTDIPELVKFIKAHSFGTLFSQTDGAPYATHLPFLIEQDDSGQYYLLGHMAKTNPHWTYIDGQVLVVFQGPHTYISPTWYQEENTVPTWNYTAVHVYGEYIPVTLQDELAGILNQTISTYEASMETPWTTDIRSSFNEQLMNMIVGFKLRITSFEGKWKLSQIHSTERRTKVIQGLRKSSDVNANQIADMMEQRL